MVKRQILCGKWDNEDETGLFVGTIVVVGLEDYNSQTSSDTKLGLW